MNIACGHKWTVEEILEWNGVEKDSPEWKRYVRDYHVKPLRDGGWTIEKND